MVEDSDFNPGFSFDFGSLGPAAQSAWDFAGAIKSAKAEAPKHKATTVDEKIKNRLAQKAATKGPQRKKVKADSDDDDEEDSEDEPLPGEDVSDDDEDIDSDDEDDEEEDDSDDADLASDDDDDQDMGDEDDEDDEGDDDLDDSEDERPAAKKPKQGDKAAPAAANGQAKAVKGEDQKVQQQAHTKPAAGDKQSQKQQQQKQQQQKQNGKQKATPQQNADNDAGADDEHDDNQNKGAAGGSKKEGFYAQTPEGTKFKASSFGDLNLSRPLVKACTALGYASPTPIQAAVIPLALAGRDICGSAVTGSGKTAAFALPCLERLILRPKQIAATYVLILTPTRELAVQIHSMITKLAQFTDISCALVVGGLSLQVQASVLRRNPEIIVATPGRLIDHLRNTQSVGLEDLAVLILDEADRLLEMGFKDEIQEIVRMTPKKRQTMLFSATFNDQVRRLMSLSLKQPVRLAADPSAAVPKDLRQEIVRLKGDDAMSKEACLLALCSRSFAAGHAIVFFRTKQRAHRIKILFGLLGLPPAAELHGDMTQAGRLESLEAFRQGKAAFLLATDVAARGLDIQGVQTVLNYDAPARLETYLHRIGRTARAGASGVAVSFITDDDRKLLKEVVKKTKAMMTQRVVPPAAIATWQETIEKAQPDVVRIHVEERQEKELRQAEMEAQKMQNMLDHEDEIKARPARTWFQSERQKKEVAKKAAAEAAGQDVDYDNDDERRAKAKAKQDAKNDRRNKRKLEAAENGDTKRKDILQEETGDFTRQIKSSKSKIRQLQSQGISSAKAARIVAAQTAGVKNKSKSKSKNKAKAGDGLFSGDGTGKSEAGGGDGAAGKSSGGSKEGTFKRDRSKLSKQELNKIKRGGVGKRAFKSKTKYKRRK